MDSPSLFKKRPKGLKPSGSTSSIRSLTSAVDQEPSKPADDEKATEDDDQVVVRSSLKGKKTPLGRVRDSSKQKTRLSFGADENESSADASTPTRKLLRAAPPLPFTEQLETSAASSNGVYSQAYLDQLKKNASKPVSQAGGDFDSLTLSKFGTALAAPVPDPDLAIPTTTAIANAKTKREQLRAAGVTNAHSAKSTRQDDYVPLTVGFANKGGDSRLVHEDDEIGDGADDMADYTGANERLPLGKRANLEAAKKLKESMSELIIDAQEDEQDEDMLDWEAAQLKRIESRNRQDDDDDDEKRRRQPYRPAPIPQTGVLPTLTSLSARLTSALSTLQQSHAVDAQSLQHFEHERTQLDEQERELRQEVEKTARKQEWFDDMKLFVDTLAGFLDEKMPLLESLEKRFEATQSEKFELVSSRRWASLSDDLALMSGASVPLNPFSQQSQEAQELQDLRPRSAQREQRRQREHMAEALTTDERADLESAVQDMRKELGDLFSDVRSSDFRDPSLGILSRFEEYRKLYKKEFDMSFAGLGLVQCWEFWARIEQWGVPLDQQHGLTETKWWSHLEKFSHRQELENAGDDDVDEPMEEENLINNLIATVVAPRLLALLPSFDPFDTRTNAVLRSKIEEISYALDKTAPRFQHLLQGVFDKFDEAINGLASLLVPIVSLVQSAPFDPSIIPARAHFLDVQLRLLTNLVEWRSFDRTRVNERAERFVELLLPVIESAWETGGMEIANRFADAWKDMGALQKRRLLRAS